MAVNRLTQGQADTYLRQARQRQCELDPIDRIVNFGNFNLRVPCLGSIEVRRRFVRASGPRYDGCLPRWT